MASQLKRNGHSNETYRDPPSDSLNAHQTDLGNELSDELLESLSNGGQVPVVSESRDNGAEELVLQFL